jgi:sortase A
VSDVSWSSYAPGGGTSPGGTAVRLVDEHDHRVVVLELDTPSPTQQPAGKGPAQRSVALRALAVALILLGGLALIDAGITLMWQEPISALYAKLRQDHLSGALRTVERAPPTATERRTLASLDEERSRIAYLAGELQRHAGAGSAVGRIRIPRIGASYVIVKGTQPQALESGPGVLSETHFPGVAGTTAIAGHRTTFLAPFRHIDSLAVGNVIQLDMPYARFTYTVIGQRVVAPTNVDAAVSNVGYSRLVLSACTPLFSAAKRLLVYARLTRTVPEGAARRLPGGGTPRPIEAPRAHSRGVHARPLPKVLESLDPHVLSPLV